jgi:hypothetical protein
MDEPQVANALVPQGFWEVACMQMMGCGPGPRCVWSFLQHPPGKHWRFKYAAVISKCTRAFRLFLCVYASAATTVGGCKTVSVGCGAGALPHIAREKAVRIFSLHAFARRCARHRPLRPAGPGRLSACGGARSRRPLRGDGPLAQGDQEDPAARLPSGPAWGV